MLLSLWCNNWTLQWILIFYAPNSKWHTKCGKYHMKESGWNLGKAKYLRTVSPPTLPLTLCKLSPCLVSKIGRGVRWEFTCSCIIWAFVRTCRYYAYSESASKYLLYEFRSTYQEKDNPPRKITTDIIYLGTRSEKYELSNEESVKKT